MVNTPANRRGEELRVKPPRQRVIYAASALTSSAPPRNPCVAADLRAGVELRKDGLHSSKEQGDIALKAHVASLCFKCFKGMLQAFYIDVAKVDLDVAHVAIAIHICFKCMF
jgi:hypothetical protein